MLDPTPAQVNAELQRIYVASTDARLREAIQREADSELIFAPAEDIAKILEHCMPGCDDCEALNEALENAERLCRVMSQDHAAMNVERLRLRRQVRTWQVIAAVGVVAGLVGWWR